MDINDNKVKPQYTCLVKKGKRFYYYQGQRIAKRKIPTYILHTIKCTTGEPVEEVQGVNLSRLLYIPKELQLQALSYLPVYDVIRLAFIVPEFAWIKSCDRSAYDLWRVIGQRLKIRRDLLKAALYPMSVLDIESMRGRTYEDLYDPLAVGDEHYLSSVEKKLRLFVSATQSYRTKPNQNPLYITALRMLVLCYSLEDDEFANALHTVLSNIGERDLIGGL